MKQRIPSFLGTFVLVVVMLASVVVPALEQEIAEALSMPSIGFQKQTQLFDGDNKLSSGGQSALGPTNQIYEVGWIRGTVDVNPEAGVDNRTVPTGTSYIRVLSSDGNYVKTNVFTGSDANSYVDVRSIVFSADKSSYYLAGQFHGTVDFDPTAGEMIRSSVGEEVYLAFVARYQTSDDSLQLVQTFEGTGSSIVEDMEYSAVHNTIAISGRLTNGADPNPTGTDETAVLADSSSTSAGFVSLYSSDLTYDRTMVYNFGQTNSTVDVDDIAYNPDNGMLAAIVRMAGNNQSLTMEFDPVGGTSDQEVIIDNNRAAFAIVFIDNGDYAGILPIALDTSIEKYDEAQFEVEYIDFDASGNLYYAGMVGRAYDEIPVDFDFDVLTGSGDAHTLPEPWSNYVTKVTPGEGYNYDSTFFYPTPIPNGVLGEYGATGMVVDPTGNVFLSGYIYVESDEESEEEGGVYDMNPGAPTDLRAIDDSTTFVLQVNSDMTFGYILTNGTENSDAGEVWPNDVSLVRDTSGNLFASSSIWYVSSSQDADTCEMNEVWQSTIATVKFGAGGASASGWLDFEPASDSYIEGCDADGDGISDADEGGVVGGDANGDDTPDREQAHVSAMASPLTESPVVLEVDDACTLSDVSIKSEVQTGNDAEFTYPLGLLDFTASCGSSGFTSTIRQIYYDPPEGDFVLRKFANGVYQTITDAIITRTTVNGQNVLVVTYDVQDGGPLDADGEANGIIVDPAGLALSGTDTSGSYPGVPNTGLKTQNNLTIVGSFIAGVLLVTLAPLLLYRSRHANYK